MEFLARRYHSNPPQVACQHTQFGSDSFSAPRSDRFECIGLLFSNFLFTFCFSLVNPLQDNAVLLKKTTISTLLSKRLWNAYRGRCAMKTTCLDKRSHSDLFLSSVCFCLNANVKTKFSVPWVFWFEFLGISVCFGVFWQKGLILGRFHL